MVQSETQFEPEPVTVVRHSWRKTIEKQTVSTKGVNTTWVQNKLRPKMSSVILGLVFMAIVGETQNVFGNSGSQFQAEIRWNFGPKNDDEKKRC